LRLRPGRFSESRREDYRFNDDVWQWKVVGICGEIADFVEDIESFEDFAEDSVFFIEFGGWCQRHKKLASVGGFGGVDRVGEAGRGD
jgi:hypothetical protein